MKWVNVWMHSFSLVNPMLPLRLVNMPGWLVRREYERPMLEIPFPNIDETNNTDWLIKRGGISMKTYLEEANCGGYIP